MGQNYIWLSGRVSVSGTTTTTCGGSPGAGARAPGLAEPADRPDASRGDPGQRPASAHDWARLAPQPPPPPPERGSLDLDLGGSHGAHQVPPTGPRDAPTAARAIPSEVNEVCGDADRERCRRREQQIQHHIYSTLQSK